MGQVVCFGDSNTWGCPPMTQSEPLRRLPRSERWTGILAWRLTGTDFEVIEEGQSGRTTVFDDPIEGEHKNGSRTLVAVLESHDPVDLVILMLGTNDFKPFFGLSAFHSARGMSTIVQMIREAYLGYINAPPEILIVAPPKLGPAASREYWNDAVERCESLAAYLAQVAERSGAFFLDANRYCAAGVDGVHIDVAGHRALGAAISDEVVSILKLRR